MPAVAVAAVAAIATYAGSAAAAALGANVFWAAVAGAVVGTVAAVGAGMAVTAITGKPKASVAGDAEGQKQMIKSPVAPRRVVYGQAKVSGPIVYAFSSQLDQSALHLVIPLADHRCQGIGTVWIDDTPVTDAEISAGAVVAGKYAGKMLIHKHLGDQITPNPNAVVNSPDGWGPYHILRGVTYLYVVLLYDKNIYQGVPNISALVYGKSDMIDPRTGAGGVYSDNWAICLYDYMTGAHGMACAADEIDLASFQAAANLSDEAVPLNAGGTVAQARYTLNGTFTKDQKPIDIVEGMLAAGAGALVYVQGQYRLKGAAYEAPVGTLTESDFAGEVQLQTMPPRAMLHNGIKGTFIDPAQFYQATEFPPLQDTTFAAADGETIWKEIEFGWINDATRAQRLARMLLYRTRAPLTLKAPLRYASLKYSVWDTVAVTLPDFGWTAKPFRITAFSFSPADGGCTVTLEEEQASHYAWLYDQALSIPNSPTTTLIDPLNIPAPTNLVQTAVSALQSDGTVGPGIDVSWLPAVHAFVTEHEVQWKLAADATWNSRDVALPTSHYLIAPVVAGASYQVRVRAVAGLVRGPFTATSTGLGGADTTAPAVPTGLATTSAFRAISVTWTQPADRDLAAVEVWENATSSTTGRAFVGETLASGFLRSGLAPSTVRYYWVRARDRSGNLSAFAGPVQGTASVLLTEDIPDALLTTAKFAQGIEPVSLVTSLPATKTTQYLTLTTGMEAGKLFYWNGTSYVRVTQAVDVTGQLSDAQIADLDAAKLSGTIPASAYSSTLRPIEVLGALPSSGNFRGRAVRLTTDDKLYTWTTNVTTTGTSFWSKAVDGADIAADSITANQIATGAISAAEIAAGAVTASKLTVAPGNLNLDPFFEDPASWSASNNRLTGWFFQATATGNNTESLGVPRAAVLTSNSGYTGTAGVICEATTLMLVTPGEQFSVRAKALNSSNRTVQAGVNFYNGTGGLISSMSVEWAPSSAASWKETQATVPATAVYCKWFAYATSGGSAYSGTAVVSQITVVRPATAEMIVDGSIIASKIAANAVTAQSIAAGAITTSKLSVGGNNLIWNSTLLRSTSGWMVGNASVSSGTPVLVSARPAGLGAWVPPAYGGGALRVPTVAVASGQACVADWRPDGTSYGVTCVAGERWQARALLGTHRCAGYLALLFFDGNNAVLSATNSTATTTPSGGVQDSNFASHQVLATAPANSVYALCRIVLQGTGGSDPFVFFTKALISKAPANATEVGEWTPGGLVDISGGMLQANSVTANEIAANTITAAQIAADTITAAQIAAGAIGATEIAASQIKATHLASEEIIAQSIQVKDLIIGTQKITDGAVTSNVFTDTDWGGFGGDNVARQHAVVTTTIGEARNGMVMATIAMGYTATPKAFSAHIRVNGTVVAVVSSSLTQPFVTWTANVNLAAGAHSFEIYWAADPGIVLNRTNLIVFLRAK